MYRNLRKMDSLGMKNTKDSSNYVFNSLQSLVDRFFGLKCSDVSFYCESPYLQKGGGKVENLFLSLLFQVSMKISRPLKAS